MDLSTKSPATSEPEPVNYHHYSLSFEPSEVGERFRDVRFVLIAGCARRAQAQATFLAERLFNGTVLQKFDCLKLTTAGSRFTLLKLGPVLVSDHGMGSASMSIAVHELCLMCRAAGVLSSITMIRFGTCGGIGVEKGTLCITTKAYNSLFEDFVELKILGKSVRREAKIDQKTAELLFELASREPNHEELGEYVVRKGATIATDDFYEEQGRTNGAICDHSQEEKMAFLRRASQEFGVINMEMESNRLASMCHKLGVSFGVACVALNNRLIADKVHLSPDEICRFERRLFWLNALFIRHHWAQ